MNKIILLASALLLTLCSQSILAKGKTKLPDWFMNPPADSLTGAHCVKSGGNFAIETKMATAGARTKLAQALNTQVDAMEKTYMSKTNTDGQISTGSTFTSVSKQVTSQMLRGSRVSNREMASINGIEHLCALVVLDEKNTRAVFTNLVDLSQRTIQPEVQTELLDTFANPAPVEDMDAAIEALLQ